MESKQQRKRRIIISLLILLIIIVVFPLVSLKYLNDGLDYRKEQLNSLKSLGQVADFKAESQDGKYISSDEKGNVFFISHAKLACDKKINQTIREYVAKFENQVVFRHVIIGNQLNCPGWDKSYFVKSEDHVQLTRQLESLTSIDDLDKKAILVDRSNEIRQIYNLNKRADLESLVTHTTIVMPPLKKER